MVPNILINISFGAYARMAPNMNAPITRNAPYTAVALKCKNEYPMNNHEEGHSTGHQEISQRTPPWSVRERDWPGIRRSHLYLGRRDLKNNSGGGMRKTNLALICFSAAWMRAWFRTALAARIAPIPIPHPERSPATRVDSILNNH